MDQYLISIHALLAESDGANCVPFSAKLQFLSTLSLRRATWTDMWRDAARLISIHALLAESDNPGQPVRGLPSYFYPRSPCGERRARNSLHRQRKNHFYPRSPCGERPAGGGDLHAGCRISIHALLAESDATTATTSWCVRYFYPRSPCGERQLTSLLLPMEWHFYPRSPCGERHCNGGDKS